MKDQTVCVHHPEVSEAGFRSLTVPTHRASTIVYDDMTSFKARGSRGFDGYTYGLHGTPTTRRLEAQITQLHGGVRSILTPSGQAAITAIMLTFLMPGDRVLIPDNAYGPVRFFCSDYLEPRDIAYTVYDPTIGAGIEALITPEVKLIWLESPGSGTMEVQDIPAIVAVAKAHGILTGCDNTWATPLCFKPLAHGVDFAVEALTKYIGGHSDLLMGSITVSDIELRQKIKLVIRDLGIGVSPDEAALALRGIETMAVRIAHVGRVALEFANRLSAFPAVTRVLHPALPGTPGHEFWKRDFTGATGVFTVLLNPGTEAALEQALSAMKTFAIGASWGGTRSLMAPISPAGERSAVLWEHRGPVVRISIGLEAEGDLWADVEKVFSAALSASLKSPAYSD
ncbi:cystathionine beta-lyase [Arenibacterium sp. LLYu02]|uniref:cystathionine beta-lyase n=1 Tax=Arenibacterium sp. LLYu02 TaxID=3404132 RepID=UPI003B21CA39